MHPSIQNVGRRAQVHLDGAPGLRAPATASADADRPAKAPKTVIEKAVGVIRGAEDLHQDEPCSHVMCSCECVQAHDPEWHYGTTQSMVCWHLRRIEGLARLQLPAQHVLHQEAVGIVPAGRRSVERLLPASGLGYAIRMHQVQITQRVWKTLSMTCTNANTVSRHTMTTN